MKVLFSGSISYDYIFDIPQKFSELILPEKIHSLNFSFVVDNFTKSYGGCAANQAYYFAKAEGEALLFAAVGKDFSEYEKRLKNLGINTSFVLKSKEKFMATGFVITDLADNQIWSFAKGAMMEASKMSLKEIVANTEDLFVMIAPNDPSAIEKFVQEAVEENLRYAFDPAFYIPYLKPEILKKGSLMAEIVFGNDYEIHLLQKRTGVGLEKLSRSTIVVETLGEKGSRIYHNQKGWEIGIYQVSAIDPTGAGDAYRSGFLRGYLGRKGIETAGKLAAAFASFAVEQRGTQVEHFNYKEALKRAKRIKSRQL